MPFRSGVPRTTHPWLQPLYRYLDQTLRTIVPSGASGVANAAWFGAGVPMTQLGNATGTIGLYGSTGIGLQVSTGGLNSTLSQSAMGASGMQATGLGNSGLYVHLARAAWNGGSGAAYTADDVVRALKNAAILPAG